MKKPSFKALLSSLLLLIFLFLAISGAMLYFGKTGMVLGFARNVLRNTHAWAALLMCILIPVHLILNLRTYLSELKTLKRKAPK